MLDVFKYILWRVKRLIETRNKGSLWNYGKLIYQFRWVVLVLWIVLFLISSSFAVKTFSMLNDTGFTPTGSESNIGHQLMRDELGYADSMLNLVYQSDTLDLTSDDEKEKILLSLESLKQSPNVTGIMFNPANRIKEDAGIQSLLVQLDLSENDAVQAFDDLKSLIDVPDEMTLYITGNPSFLNDFDTASKKGIVRAEMIGLPIAIVILVLIFRTLSAAVLPLLMAVKSIVLTMGIIYFFAGSYSLSNFLPNIVTMLGLAVGIDYALFMVSRFREELEKCGKVDEAVAMTAQTAGKSIIFSGIAVLIGLIGMFFIDLNLFRSLALGGIIVVSLSVILANTFLLAMFSLLGDRINSLRVLPKKKVNEPSFLWANIARFVMRRAVFIVIIAIALLSYFMIPMTDLKLATPTEEVISPAYDSRFGADLFNEVYDERESKPIYVVVSTEEGIWNEHILESLLLFEEQIVGLDNISNVQSFLSSLPYQSKDHLLEMVNTDHVLVQLQENRIVNENTILFIVVPETSPYEEETTQLVKGIRGIEVNGLKTYVTGQTSTNLDIVEKIKERIILVIAFILVATYVILLIAFRSVLLPLKAVFMNILGIGASIGIVVSIVQYGYLADLFLLTSIGYISPVAPVLIFCVVFGISMDYEVFLLSRIAEEYDASQDNDQSTAEGLRKTGSLITSAALILIVVVGAFMFTDIEVIKVLGIGLTLAIFIDATIIRALLVPALMKLLGKANWWAPKWLAKKEYSTESTSEGVRT
jgi:RND superfamily putative drug exporter